MAVVLDLNLDGGSQGTAANTTNTAGPTGAFDAMEIGLTFDGTTAQHGAFALLSSSTASSYARKDFSSTTVTHRIGFRCIGNPVSWGADVYLYRLSVGTTRYVSLRIVNGTGKIRVEDFASANNWTAANALAADTDYWLDISVDGGTTTSNGKITFDYYPKNSTTPVETGLASTTANCGSGTAFTRAYMLKYAGGTQQLAFDDCKLTTDFTRIGIAAIAYTGAPADAVGATDALSGALGMVRSQGDAVGATDSPSAVVAAYRTQADPVGVADAVSAVVTAVVQVAEAVGIVDTPGPQTLGLDVQQDDAVGVADAVTQVAAVVQVLADAAGISDATSAVISAVTLVSDPAGISDTATALTGFTKGPGDSAGVGDQVALVVGVIRTVDDLVGVGDAVSALLSSTIEQAATDPVGVTDSTSTLLSLPRSADEPVGVSDQVSGVLSFVQDLTEALDLEDVISTLAVSVRTFDDEVGVTETVVAVLIPAMQAPPDSRRIRFPGGDTRIIFGRKR